MSWLISSLIAAFIVLLRFLQNIDSLAILVDVGQCFNVFDPGCNYNSIGTLADGADNLVVGADFKVSAIDNDAATTHLEL